MVVEHARAHSKWQPVCKSEYAGSRGSVTNKIVTRLVRCAKALCVGIYCVQSAPRKQHQVMIDSDLFIAADTFGQQDQGNIPTYS